jgi:hypothetical protein
MVLGRVGNTSTFQFILPIFSSFLTVSDTPRLMRILCTCGCGRQVTHATKINHLNGRGKISLRSRVLEENESLKQSTRQQPVFLRDHQKKKRLLPSSNQTGNSKRLKVAWLEVDQIPEIPPREDAVESSSLSVPNEESEILPVQAYADVESHTQLTASQVDAGPEEFAHQSNSIAGRIREVAEQRWGNSNLRDKIPRSDCGEDSYGSEDEEGVDLNMTGNEDSDDEDNDEDREEEDGDLFAESDVSGISAWHLLGEGFEREATSIGMSLAHESFVLLTIV